MAERLVDRYGADVPRRLAAGIAAVHPGFPTRRFVADALAGYDELDLMARGRRLGEVLRAHLPPGYEAALEVLRRSMGPPPAGSGGDGLPPFFYLPHSFFVALYGLDHFEASMAFQHELTQRFTAEFSIRPYLERHPQATLARLRRWAADPSAHVRRLVSEGTRPRLPWAPRLRSFQQDPRPVLALLELLKDDPEEYVRRSVANNLNDIGKDHPALAAETARRWLREGGEARRWIVERALRSAVKRGEREALEVLGYGRRARVAVHAAAFDPPKPRIGGQVRIAFEVVNEARTAQEVLVDLRVHFVKASGRAAPKTFKLKCVRLPAGGRVVLEKKVSLAQLTTRRHYPGPHRVEALCNGAAFALGAFELRGATGR